MWEINRESEMTKARRNREYLGILAFRGNKEAHQWNVTLTDGGEPITKSGKTVQGIFIYEDGAQETVTGSMTGNVATVTFPETVYTHPGYCRAYLRIIQGVRETTMDAIVFYVERIKTE